MTRAAARSDQVHPSPKRGQTSLLALFFGLMAGPTGWIIQHLIAYGLANYVCYPSDVARTSPLPGWDWLRPALITLTATCLLISGAGAYVAYRSWRSTRSETTGDHPAAVEVGAGRSRFLAISGLIISILFGTVIAFNAVPLLGAPYCRG